MITNRCVCHYESDPPCPFCAEKKRDLNADLAICNEATAGSWFIMHDTDVMIEDPPGSCDLDQIAWCSVPANARFIAEARTGWPHAIERALTAEALLDSHGPDGRSYSNYEYVMMRDRAIRAEAENVRLSQKLAQARNGGWRL